jgi:1-deoxy-D-xylulose-5-phosphate synthase
MNETDSTLPPLLARITHPSMVADLSLADKQILATELRQTIIRTVAANGGHLAPSLGVVELTLALLSVFDPEEDKLVWDVGMEAADRKVRKLPYLAPAWRYQRFSENRRKPV